jgi:alkylation response protein AidB-like acyl-CoA dehydrogenase
MIAPEMQKEELELVLSTIKGFGKRRLELKTLLHLDKQETCPEDLIRELLGPDVGIHLAFIPTAYGGLGGGVKDIFQISECVAGIDLGIATSLLGISLGTDPLRVGGTEAQKNHWMKRVADEGLVVAYAVTEPSAGSDLASIRSTATPVVENGKTVAYLLNGNKQFITNGGIADFCTVLAVAPGGPSFFVVEKGTPGLTPGKAEEKHGIRASNTTPLTLENVRVPLENLIGGVEGQGLSQAQQVFGFTRVMVAAFGLGCAVTALGKAVIYGKERVQGGALLCDHPGWSYKLIAPHAVALEAARSYIEWLSERLDSGEPNLEVEGAIAKMTASEEGNATAEAAIQAHGGYGYIHEYHVEKLKRDVRITCIYEGTTEILQRTIARDRWRLHLQTKGDYYAQITREMEALESKSPGCGAALAALSARVLQECMEACRIAHLTRNQHVLFTLGLLCARVEVAAAFARKVAAGNPDTSHYSLDTLKAMSRLWARRVARELHSESMALVAGGGALAGPQLREFEKRLHLDKIHDQLAGELDDLGVVTQFINAN